MRSLKIIFVQEVQGIFKNSLRKQYENALLKLDALYPKLTDPEEIA